MNVTIREINHDDWPIWRSVRLQALAESPAAFGSTLAEWIDATDDRWRDRIRDVTLNLVALHDNHPIAQVSANLDEPASTVELTSMWVSPAARGTGVADTLINTITTWANDRHARHIVLSVKHTNHHARRLYERHHFVVDGAGDDPDELRMTRPLPQTSPAPHP